MKRVIAQGNKLDAATAQLSLDKYNALKTSTKVKEILKQGAIVATGGAVGVAGVEGAYVGQVALGIGPDPLHYRQYTGCEIFKLRLH